MTLSMTVILLGMSSASFALSFYGGANTGLSTENLGSFFGELTYNAIDDSSATLTLELENTSDADNGGYITGFAFNNPEDLISGVSFSSTDTDFNLIGNDSFQNGIKAKPFSNFDIGASLGDKNSLMGSGGNPTPGIAVGAAETFTFTFSGTGLSALTEQSFIDQLNGQDPFFMARFKGFENGGSDKVPGVPYDPNVVVPEPATLLLMGLGLVGVAALRRKRR